MTEEIHMLNRLVQHKANGRDVVIEEQFSEDEPVRVVEQALIDADTEEVLASTTEPDKMIDTRGTPKAYPGGLNEGGS